MRIFNYAQTRRRYYLWFVFPILKDTESAKIQAKRIKQFTKQVNKYMKRIGVTLGIEANITTYTARHSFATVLKKSGVSMEFISENLAIQTSKQLKSIWTALKMKPDMKMLKN
jgi:integrase/recombinase XerD